MSRTDLQPLTKGKQIALLVINLSCCELNANEIRYHTGCQLDYANSRRWRAVVPPCKAAQIGMGNANWTRWARCSGRTARPSATTTALPDKVLATGLIEWPTWDSVHCNCRQDTAAAGWR